MTTTTTEKRAPHSNEQRPQLLTKEKPYSMNENDEDQEAHREDA
jgi:hypothetical protein